MATSTKRIGSAPDGGTLKRRIVITHNGGRSRRVTGSAPGRRVRRPVKTAPNTPAPGSYRALAKKRRGVKIKARRPKNYKIDKKFRAKVKKVFEQKANKGTMLEINARTLLPVIPDNQQASEYLHEPGPTAGLFSPNRVLDAASCLFNDKISAKDKTVIVDNFPTTTCKVNVLKQYCTFRITNSTRRTKNMTIYTAKVKKGFADNQPLSLWATGLTLDFQVSPAGTANIGNNFNSVAQTFLRTKPQLSKTFNQVYKVMSQVVILQPGQIHEFVVHGDAMMYDMNKYHRGSNISLDESVPPTTYVWATVFNDLVLDTGGRVGRFEDILVIDKPESMLIETTMYYQIEQPADTGFITPNVALAAGVPNPLNLVKNPYIRKNYTDAQFAASNITRIDPLVPTEPMLLD